MEQVFILGINNKFRLLLGASLIGGKILFSVIFELHQDLLKLLHFCPSRVLTLAFDNVEFDDT